MPSLGIFMGTPSTTAPRLTATRHRRMEWLCAGVTVFCLVVPPISPAAARGSFAAENPLAAEHVEALPLDIRRIISVRARACGNKAAASHYFSVSIEAEGFRFISLHFEDFACANRVALCSTDGCLHEVYLETRGGHRRVFSTHARDLKLTNDGVAGIEVLDGTSIRLFRWNGRRFVPVGIKKDNW